MLPGWYGTGTALNEWIAEDDARLARLQDLTTSGRSSAPCCRTWAWCWRSRTSGFARRYADLVSDPDLRHQVLD